MKKPRLLVLSGYIDPQKDSKISLCKIVIVYECVFFWVHDLREKLQHSISPALPSFISPSATYVFFCFLFMGGSSACSPGFRQTCLDYRNDDQL